MNISLRTVGRWLAIILCLYYSYELVFSPNHWIFIDNANLFIHEGGHFLFFFLGQLLYILGGSLTQILLPVAFLIYFLRRFEFFATSVMLFWVANNIINVSVYMGDAIKMQLPLLGGESSIHDWHYLFARTGLLQASPLISTAFFIFGTLLLLLSIVGLIVTTLLQTK